MADSERRTLSRPLSLALIAAAAVGFGLLGAWRVAQHRESQPAPRRPLRVPLFVPPEQVVYDEGIELRFDPPERLTALRLGEGLDAVVAGAVNAEEALWRLARWTRAQFEPGRPDPYPPPDAVLILHEIRADRTGGFCAQYAFVFMQAAASLGLPTRVVTIQGHEITESWLPDQRRWVLFDPMYLLQVLDEDGRSLSALEVRRAHAAGRPVTLSPGNSYPGSTEEYLDRFRTLAVWARNDFISRPLNFSDFDRCRVWIDPIPAAELPPGALHSRDGRELYQSPPGH